MVIGNRQVTELPLLGRNTYALAMRVPGVRPSAGVNNLVIDQISTVSYSINGQRANSNEFLLDGAPNTAASQNQPVINANPDMVRFIQGVVFTSVLPDPRQLTGDFSQARLADGRLVTIYDPANVTPNP